MEHGGKSLRLGGQQKLIPRDIAGSLGKLPPQNLELEADILGALMLEVKSTAEMPAAVDRVPFLLPDHFYDDRHSEIFRAIKQVVADGALPDMRMVVSKLRDVGKIELVGGAYYVAQLTAGVHSASNIVPHARKVVEQAMKRMLIQIASKIHHDAYEDTTDVFDLLKKTREDLLFLEERETASSGPERIKALWQKYEITIKPERPPTLISLGGADVCTVGNLSLLIGKKKSRKSLLVTHMLWLFLTPKHHTSKHVVVFDTEQEEYDVWAARDRLFRMTNQYVSHYVLRGLNPKERREFIELTIAHTPGLFIAVIDGIRDCMSNINDPDESTEVLSWLMRMNVQYRVHIINILHINKTDNNARGHIGSELLNKAEVTIEVQYDEKSTFSMVKCESSRRKPFEPFMFTHGPTGLPEMVGIPSGDGPVAQDDQIKKLELVFEGEMLSRKELEEQIQAHFAVGHSKARRYVAQWVTKGWVLKSGKDRNPNTKFKLVAQPGVTVSLPENHQNTLDFAENNSINPVDTTHDLPF